MAMDDIGNYDSSPDIEGSCADSHESTWIEKKQIIEVKISSPFLTWFKDL
jgi:hypothetical protein